MRILFVISGLGYGGAERQVVLLAKELCRRGHAVMIYTLNRHVPRAVELEGTPVELVVDQKRTRLDLGVIRRLRRTARTWRAQVIHGFLLDGDVYARLAGAGSGLPVLNSERNDNHRLSLSQRIAYRLTSGLEDGWVANSHSGAAFAERTHRLDGGSVHVVWNGIDLAEVRQRLSRSTRPARTLWPAPARIVTVVGSIKPQKDHALALRVCASLRRRSADWRFLFVGDSLTERSEYKQDIHRLRTSLGLDEVSTFTGVRNDVLELVGSSDVLLMTSHFEGFPNAVLEAMACGTPVASTEYSDIRRIVPLAWQVSDRRDPDALADIVERCSLEHDDVARAQLDWVEAHATVERSAMAMLEVYQRYVATGVAATQFQRTS